MFEYPLLFVFPIAMVFAAVMDVMTMTIPNRISLALIAGFALLAPFSPLGLTHILLNHVLVGAALLAIGIVMFEFRLIGGGDIKLLASSSLWIGLDKLPEFLLVVSLAGGVLGVGLLAYRRFVPAAALLAYPGWAVRLHEKGHAMPYGVAISAGALLIFPTAPFYLGFAG